jgi:hypothetical protein
VLNWRSWLPKLAIAVVIGGPLLWLAIAHPAAGWLPGQARKSALPPIFAAGLLGIPLAVGVMGVRELWFELSLARAARHLKRHA